MAVLASKDHAARFSPAQGAVALLAALVLASGLLIVGRGPADGQSISVIVNGDALRLEPATIRAGDVLVVVGQEGSKVILARRTASPGEAPGPLSTDEVNLLSEGRTMHVSITRGFANGGPLGLAVRLTLAPGRYVFLPDEPAALAARSGGLIEPRSMAVLEVQP